MDERALAHRRVSQHPVGAPVVVVELGLVGWRVELGQLAVVEVARRLLGLGADRQLAGQVGGVRADRQAEHASVVEEQAQPAQPLGHRPRRMAAFVLDQPLDQQRARHVARRAQPVRARPLGEADHLLDHVPGHAGRDALDRDPLPRNLLCGLASPRLTDRGEVHLHRRPALHRVDEGPVERPRPHVVAPGRLPSCESVAHLSEVLLEALGRAGRHVTRGLCGQVDVEQRLGAGRRVDRSQRVPALRAERDRVRAVVQRLHEQAQFGASHRRLRRQVVAREAGVRGGLVQGTGLRTAVRLRSGPGC